LNRIWVDSLVHDEDALELLIKKFGQDKVVLGSDYPFILGEHRVRYSFFFFQIFFQ